MTEDGGVIAGVQARLAEEGIARYYFAGPPSGSTADKVCVYAVTGGWELIITDERAVPEEETRRTFPDEASAAEGALVTVRSFARAMDYRAHPRGTGRDE